MNRVGLIRNPGENEGSARYDNERGKGDHRHAGDVEQSYTFTDLEKLFVDFEKDVREVLKK